MLCCQLSASTISDSLYNAYSMRLPQNVEFFKLSHAEIKFKLKQILYTK